MLYAAVVLGNLPSLILPAVLEAQLDIEGEQAACVDQFLSVFAADESKLQKVCLVARNGLQ